MRNLKKVLALALATVMLLGMMAMASAADYADEAQITAKYDYAVDVMQAIGVFEGTKTADGTYLYPTNTLSRAEAAKVITFVALTKANASKLGTAEAPFADVPADHWAAGSIAYAKNLGIVSGKGENKYDPQGTLTGYEFAKMLLVVLGYKADVEGFTGSGWSTNIDSVALSAGLKKNLDINMGAYITREEACQMAVNALQADCVQYSGNTNISFGDTVIAIGGNRSKTEQTLMQKLYPNLQKSAAADNAFGYDVYTWTNGATEVASEPAYTVLGSYAGTAATLTKGAIFNMFGVDNTTYHVYENGADTTTVYADKGSTAVELNLGAYAGAKVEFVKNVSGSKEVIVTVPTLTKVLKVVDATATEVRKVQLDVNADGVYTEGTDYLVKTEKYAKGDYVLAYVAGSPAAVKKHEAAETVYGTMTQATKKDGLVTTLYVDGTAIPVAGANVDTDADAFSGALNKKYTVVLSNGYAIDVVGDVVAADLTSYVYVYGGGAVAGAYVGAASSYEAKVVNMDGTTAVLKVEPEEAGVGAGTEKGTLNVADFSYNSTTGVMTVTNGLYKVSDADLDGKKSFDLMKNLGDATGLTGAPAFAAVDEDIVKAATDKSETFVSNSQKAYYTADTKVLTIKTSAAGVTTGTVTAIPTAATYDDAETYAIYKYNTTAKVREIVMVVTWDTDAIPSDDLYYVIGTEVGKVYVAAAEKTYAQYVAYDLATGEKKTVMVPTTAAPSTGFATVASVNEYGAYTFGAAVAGRDYVLADTLSLYKNILTIDSSNNAYDFSDYDASEAVVVDNTTAGIKTVADLATKEAAANTATLNYSIMVDGTTAKVVAIVVTAYTKTA